MVVVEGGAGVREVERYVQSRDPKHVSPGPVGGEGEKRKLWSPPSFRGGEKKIKKNNKKI